VTGSPGGSRSAARRGSRERRHLGAVEDADQPEEGARLPLGIGARPPSAEAELVSAKVADARHLFRSRHSDVGDRRRAVRELVDVLEAIRADVRTELMSGDERDLFNIANNFAIRHNNTSQKRDYDELWLGYLFQLFLSNIHLVLRLREREERTSPEAA
jgi:hypothetical protein